MRADSGHRLVIHQLEAAVTKKLIYESAGPDVSARASANRWGSVPSVPLCSVPQVSWTEELVWVLNRACKLADRSQF